MIYHFDQSLIWHVVFHPGKTWWSRKYRHVSLAGYSNDTWLHLDVNIKGVSVANLYHYDEVHDYLTYLVAHYHVLRFGPTLEKSRQFFSPLTCVSFVKHVLGVRSCALLPDGLERTLRLNYGAEVIHEGQGTSGNSGTEAATATGGS